MSNVTIPELYSRVLVLKAGLDAVDRVSALLRPAGLHVEECAVPHLADELERGAGALVLDERIFTSPLASLASLKLLASQIETQVDDRPIPVVLLRDTTAPAAAPLRNLHPFCTIEDPVESLALISVVRAALGVGESQRRLAACEADLTAATEELRLASVRKDEWLAARGHELRNPLSSIVAGLELIRMKADLERPGLERAINIVERQAYQLTERIEQMLHAARADRGTAAPLPPSLLESHQRDAGNGRRHDFPTRRVLIVDDNADAADSLGALLSALGAVVCVAHSGREALARLDSFAPDSAIVDVGMPDMDGYELARRLRASRRFNHNLIIALTGWGEPQDRERSKRAGIDHHLVKPPDLGTLRHVLDRRRIERHA